MSDRAGWSDPEARAIAVEIGGCGVPLGHSGHLPVSCGQVGSYCRRCRQHAVTVLRDRQTTDQREADLSDGPTTSSTEPNRA